MKELLKKFLQTEIPIAWIAGVRIKEVEENKASVKVKYAWLNQNPFKSMFWAVQGMAAEFSTGVMCIAKAKGTGENISTLVIGLQAKFTKKAVGKIVFTCDQGELIDQTLQKAIETGEGQIITLKSIGIDKQGDQVAEFDFTWSFKLRK